MASLTCHPFAFALAMSAPNEADGAATPSSRSPNA